MARAPLDVNPDASNPTVVVTHVRAGTGHWTLARNDAVDITSTSHQRVHSHRATSCRKPPQDRASAFPRTRPKQSASPSFHPSLIDFGVWAGGGLCGEGVGVLPKLGGGAGQRVGA